MKVLSETLMALGVLVALFCKADPFHWFMPTEIQMVILCILTAALALFAGAVFREKPADERESQNLYRASRWGFVVGLISITVVIVVQDVLHQLDPWLLLILGLMVVTKLAVWRWSQWKR